MTATWMMSLWVGIGSGFGSVLRFLVSRRTPSSTGFPWTTWAINVLGAFALGVVVHQLGTLGSASQESFWGLLLGTGVCGGFTTFSAFSTDTVRLLRTNRQHAVTYLAASVLVGGLATWLGLRVI